MSNEFRTLREANIARNAIWDPKGILGILWRAVELAGEIGELAEAPGWQGIIAEGADVLICVDLALLGLGVGPLDLSRPTIADEQRWTAFKNYGQQERGVLGRFVMMQGLLYCNTAKKLQREIYRMPGSRATYADAERELRDTGLIVLAMFYVISYDAELAVRAKFNATSIRNGFNVVIGEPAP